MSKSVFVAVSLLASVSPANAAPRGCLAVVQDWQNAVDFQEIGSIRDLTWEDGYSQWPGRNKTKWSAIHPSGPPKYNTTLREIRVSRIDENRQSVRLKEISRRLDINPDTGGFNLYTGDYSVSKVAYTCERRNGQWKILSQVVTHTVNLQNKAAVRRYEKLRQP